MSELKYPYQILLEGSPHSSELEFQFGIDLSDGEMSWWEELTPEQAIKKLRKLETDIKKAVVGVLLMMFLKGIKLQYKKGMN